MVRDRRGLGWLGWLITLVVVTSVFWGAYFALLAPKVPAAYVPPVAEKNDYVEVNYRGFFSDAGFAYSGKTFDTSIEAVAENNATYPKAASFQFRTGASAYTPLGFVLGCTGGSGCPLESFQAAVYRLHPGGTKTFYIPAADGYGVSDPAKIHVRQLYEDVPATEVLNKTQYQSRYGNSPLDGSTVQDAVWGWNVTVRVSGTTVTLRNSPVIGQTYTVAKKWPAVVVSIDDGANGGQGAIRVHHLLAAADVSAFVATDRTGNFLVVALDPAAGTFTVDYNHEVVGKTLGFAITVTTIRKANP